MDLLLYMVNCTNSCTGSNCCSLSSSIHVMHHVFMMLFYRCSQKQCETPKILKSNRRLTAPIPSSNNSLFLTLAAPTISNTADS